MLFCAVAAATATIRLFIMLGAVLVMSTADCAAHAKTTMQTCIIWTLMQEYADEYQETRQAGAGFGEYPATALVQQER
jgi:hypothetical protein